LAEGILTLIDSLPNIQFADLDFLLAQQAALIARTQRLRGADAVYVAVAQVANATLITWDTEMLQRASAVVATLTPLQW
jgi:predicted nucleic acid-binding protein